MKRTLAEIRALTAANVIPEGAPVQAPAPTNLVAAVVQAVSHKPVPNADGIPDCLSGVEPVRRYDIPALGRSVFQLQDGGDPLAIFHHGGFLLAPPYDFLPEEQPMLRGEIHPSND